MCSSLAFGVCPSRSSLRSCTAFLAVDLAAQDPSRGLPEHAFTRLFRAAHPHRHRLRCTSRPHHRDGPASSARLRDRSCRLTSPFGSLRRHPTHAHAAVPCCLATARRPTGFASPGSSRVVDLPALFHAGSSMGTHPSEVSPRSSPHDPLGSRRPPCRSSPCGAAAPRISASRLVHPCGRPMRCAQRAARRTDAFSMRRRCSRHHRVAPLLVVSPLRG
jgi:hypothetical protein